MVRGGSSPLERMENRCKSAVYGLTSYEDALLIAMQHRLARAFERAASLIDQPPPVFTERLRALILDREAHNVREADEAGR